jgi:hypothetical protein
VLVVDTTHAEYLDLALNLICPIPGDTGLEILQPAAIILETFHLSSPSYSQPASINNEDNNRIPLSAIELVHQLTARGLPLTNSWSHPGQPGIPYILYTADEYALDTAWDSLEPVHATYSSTGTTAGTDTGSFGTDTHTFSAVVTRNGNGTELLPVLSRITGINFCDACHNSLYPTDSALLLTPNLYCATCASELSATERRGRTALFPAHLLARAGRIFSSPPAASPHRPALPPLSTAALTTNLWDM